MKRLIWTGLLLALLALTAVPARADTPYTTWALGPKGLLVMTQDAYTPLNEVDLPVSGPEDMFVTKEGVIYVADAGNERIVRLDNNYEVVQSYGEEVLDNPTGIFVDDEGVIYVADAGLAQIVIIGADGEIINQFGRPTEPLFGRNREFLPRKIAVDARENLYIISEGSVNGIVQMNTMCNFIGYFGANSASMSLKMILQRLFLTDEQLAQFIRNEAASPSNLTIDHQSLVFTITAGTSPEKAIRRFTISGKNIYPDTWGSTAFRDIDVSETGVVLAVAPDGIFEYDLNGTLLFVFGAQDTGNQRLGTLRNPTAIARRGEQIIVLDKDKNGLVLYETTAFARQVHEGVRLYMGGYYQEAKPYFEDVLDFNGSFIMAYQAIADAYFKEFDYEKKTVKAIRRRSGSFGLAPAELADGNGRPRLRGSHASSLPLGDPLAPGWRAEGDQAGYTRFMFRFIKKPADNLLHQEEQEGSCSLPF